MGPFVNIGYSEVLVSAELLAKLELEKQNAIGWGKYAKFKQWLHYANLDRWQKQGYHFHYLTAVSHEQKKLICTCGLYLVEGSEDEELIIPKRFTPKVTQLLLDRVQTVRGHRSLENFQTITCALVVNFVWTPKNGEYRWTAFCQECGEIVVEQLNEVAKGFVDAHNKKCQVRHE